MLRLPVFALASREIIRFTRQPSRVLGIIASPALFWVVIGSGLKNSFQLPTGPPGINYLEYFFPGTVVLIVMFTAIFGTISLIEDRREGFLQSVLVSPIPRSMIVLGKVLGVASLALAQGILFVLLAPTIGIGLNLVSLLGVAVMLFLVAFALSSLGFAIAWNMESTQGFHVIMNLCLLPMWMLSGALFPISGAAGWVQTLMELNPLMYGVAGVRMILYGVSGGAGGEGLPALENTILATIAFGLVTFLIATVMIRKH